MTFLRKIIIITYNDLEGTNIVKSIRFMYDFNVILDHTKSPTVTITIIKMDIYCSKLCCCGWGCVYYVFYGSGQQCMMNACSLIVYISGFCQG